MRIDAGRFFRSGAENGFRVFVAGIDTSRGLTPYLQQNPDIVADVIVKQGPRNAYLSALEAADVELGKLVGHPQDVFYGRRPDGSTATLRGITESRDEPPATHFWAQLVDIQTPNPTATTRQLLNLALSHADLGEQERLRIASTLPRRMRVGSKFGVAIDDNWRFQASVSFTAKAEPIAVSSGLIPIEKPKFSQDWIDEHSSQVLSNLDPVRVQEAIVSQSRGNFCVKSVTMGDVALFDIGGSFAFKSMLSRRGWRRIGVGDPDFEEIEVDFYGGDRAYRLVQREDSMVQINAAPFLRSSYNARDGRVRISGLVSPDLSRAIREEYSEQFYSAMEDHVDVLIKRYSNEPDGEYDLSPKAIVAAALEATRQHLSANDFERELPQLAARATVVLGQKLSDHPRFGPAVEHMHRMILLNERGVSDDNGIDADWGFQPDKVKIVFGRNTPTPVLA